MQHFIGNSNPIVNKRETILRGLDDKLELLLLPTHHVNATAQLLQQYEEKVSQSVCITSEMHPHTTNAQYTACCVHFDVSYSMSSNLDYDTIRYALTFQTNVLCNAFRQCNRCCRHFLAAYHDVPAPYTGK
jgi:hypothetical protein